MDHLADAVEEFDSPGHHPSRALREALPEPVLARAEEDQQELCRRIADMDAVGPAAPGGRLVQADLDLDGDDSGKHRIADGGAQPPIHAGDGKGQQKMGGRRDLQPFEQFRGLRADPVERGQFGKKGKENFGAAAHGAKRRDVRRRINRFRRSTPKALRLDRQA